MKIVPTVGRVVWYRPAGNENIARHDPAQPLAAIVTHVWSDHCVNLAVFDANGNVFGQTSVHLKQSDDELPPKPYAEWMPFQVGQAKKHEAETPQR